LAIYLYRHALTEGNRGGRYIGCKTDEPLCEEGILEAKSKRDLSIKKVFSSPMKRCTDTAKLIFPNAEISVIEDFREIDFGEFEGKNFEDLKENSDYSNWVNAFCEPAPPNGESLAKFNKRVRAAFDKISATEKDIFIVTHAGVIMSIMSYLHPEKPYYEYKIANCERIVVSQCHVDLARISDGRIDTF
jgi:alpha-ribazole phosphatase